MGCHALHDCPLPRSLCVVSTNSGNIVVMGGMGFGGTGLDVVQVYNCGAQSWHRGPSLPGACWGASSVVKNGMIYVAGGTGMENSVWCAEVNKLVSITILMFISTF